LKCSQPNGFDENDHNLDELLKLITEFDQHVFIDSDLMNSDIGKLFETLRLIIGLNKAKLGKTGDILQSIIAKMVIKIKGQVKEAIFDPSQYVAELNIPIASKATEPKIFLLIDNDVKNVFTKLEEYREDSVRKLKPKKVKVEEKKESIPLSTKEYPIEILSDDEWLGKIAAVKRKFCKKLQTKLQNLYVMENVRAHEVAMMVENRIRRYYPKLINGFFEEYKKALRDVYKLIKSKTIKETELESISDWDLSQYHSLGRMDLGRHCTVFL